MDEAFDQALDLISERDGMEIIKHEIVYAHEIPIETIEVQE